MITQVRIGEEYEWSREGKKHRVVVSAQPIRVGYDPSPSLGEGFPQPVLQCEVELIPTGRRQFVPLSELMPVAH